jgi:hypothetical protein
MTCKDRRGYRSKGEAKKALRHMETKIPGETASRIYRCPLEGCHMWHLAMRREPARELPPSAPPADTGRRP